MSSRRSSREPVVKLMLRHDRLLGDALLGRAARSAVTWPSSPTRTLPTGCSRSAPPGVSKASTLARLCDQRGIDRRDVIAFGDMPNDLPMLGWAGHSVAVANAHPDVIASAHEVTASNDEAGVARVLERLFGLS